MSHVHEALRKASQYGEPEPSSSLSPELKKVGDALLRRKVVFLSIFFGVFLAATAYVVSMPKKYEAEMKLLVKNERQELVISPDSNTNTVHSAEPSETDINSEIEMLRSSDVLRTVALKTGLAKPEPGSVQAAGEVSPVSLDKALIGLEHDLSISPVKKSNIIDITYSSKNPEVASALLRNLADVYLESHLKLHGAPGTYAFFEGQANAYKDRLKVSEDALKAFQQKYSSLVLPDQDQALTTRSVDSQASLEDVDAQIADYQHRIAQTQKSLAALDPRVVTSVRTSPQAQLIANLNQTLVELRNKRTDLAVKFRPDDRMVLEVDKQIADTTTALNDAVKENSAEKSTDVNPVRQNAEKDLVSDQVALSGLLARRASLAHVAGTYKGQMLSLADLSIQHDQLTRQVKENEDNYLLYEKKREEARIAESLDQQRITNVAVVQSPTTPVQPSSPKVKLDILLSAILAAFLASTAVLILEFTDPKAADTLRPRRYLAAAVND